MFEKILIANRGEIAIRIARTVRRMGLAVAGVCSDADADAPHVQAIGEVLRLGPAPARESYLAIDRVVAAARRSGCDAVHPGYGFLSENAAFADALQQAGIAFIGPSAQVLRSFGDKAAAKRLAAQAGVPTIPGSDAASADAAQVRAMVRAVGLPALLKAAAGGGGKGIRVLHDERQIDDEIAAAMREGASAFGDPSLLVERYLPHGRHVEVQILGDGHGHVLHLWERECSLQRRHQKVIEEAPALPLPPGLREQLLQAAVALGRSVHYRALGTVEFLVAGDRFCFLEVNPRLQVEHPVTEAITGLDLVELQIRAAAGEPLTLAQDAVRCEGHAIEARLYAEDPEHGFVPAAGVVQRLHWPAQPGLRVDSGVVRGSTVTPHYDPMLAKLVAHAAHRPQALRQLREALSGARVAGLATNLGFLLDLLRSPAVADAVPDTGTIERLTLPRGDAKAPSAGWRTAAGHVAAAWALQRERRDDPALPASSWSSLTHWRLGAADACWRPLQPQYALHTAAGAEPVTVATGRHGASRCRVRVADTEHGVEMHARGEDWRVVIDGTVHTLSIGLDDGHEAAIWVSDGRHTEARHLRPALAHARARGAHAGADLPAPLTGKVLEVRVRDGDRVIAGQVLVVLESMKMELRVSAPHAGVARGIEVTAGAMVERGARLVSVEPVDGVVA